MGRVNYGHKLLADTQKRGSVQGSWLIYILSLIGINIVYR